jgi:hypothetical protein
MEDEDDAFTDVEQAIRDRIDDELVNQGLLERSMLDDGLVRKPARPQHPPA